MAEKQTTKMDNKGKQESPFLQHVGKEFFNSDGVNATVREFVPKHLVKDKWVPSFLVNYGHPNMSFYVDAETFLKDFQPKEKGK